MTVLANVFAARLAEFRAATRTILLVDDAGTIVSSTGDVEQELGCSPHDLSGQLLAQIIPEPAFARLRRAPAAVEVLTSAGDARQADVSVQELVGGGQTTHAVLLTLKQPTS